MHRLTSTKNVSELKGKPKELWQCVHHCGWELTAEKHEVVTSVKPDVSDTPAFSKKITVKVKSFAQSRSFSLDY